MRGITERFCLISVLALAFAVASCRMNYSFTGASISKDVKTVSVQYFQNLSGLVNPTFSSYITEELKNKFITQTNLGVVSGSADLLFSGQITRYSVAPTAIQSNEVAARNRLTVSVIVKFVNSLDPKQSYEKAFTHYADFDSDQNFSQIENELVRQIVEKLIDDIFNNALANW